jgi:TonB family protein
LNDGVAGQDYASHLLELARSIGHRRLSAFSGFPAPAMARPSSLERRFSAMLNQRVNRAPLTRSSRTVIGACVFALAILVAGFGAAQTFATFSGSAFDPTNRMLPGVTVVLTNADTHSKYQVDTDATGGFRFVGLPPGDYTWEAKLAGFANLKGALTVSGRDVQQDLALAIGSLVETVMVRGGTPTREDPAVEARRRLEQQARVARAAEKAAKACSGPVKGPVGGQILPPTAIGHLAPSYPEPLVAGRVGGLVELQAIIGTSGDMRDVAVVSSPDASLAGAAVEAVRQWTFTQTLLNCEPIEVHMQVHIRFVAE